MTTAIEEEILKIRPIFANSYDTTNAKKASLDLVIIKSMIMHGSLSKF